MIIISYILFCNQLICLPKQFFRAFSTRAMYASLLFSSKTNLTNDAQFLREELNNVLPPPCPCPENKLVPVQPVLLLYICSRRSSASEVLPILPPLVGYLHILLLYIGGVGILSTSAFGRLSIYIFYCTLHLQSFFCSKSYKLLQEKCEYVIVYIGVS